MSHYNTSPLETLIKIALEENISFEILRTHGQTNIKINGLLYVSNTASFGDLNQVAFKILSEGIRVLCDQEDQKRKRTD